MLKRHRPLQWYIRTENHQIVETRRNPPSKRTLRPALLVALLTHFLSEVVMIAMGFSMACGLVANLALIARFLERRVKLNTWVAMIFLAIHGTVLGLIRTNWRE